MRVYLTYFSLIVATVLFNILAQRIFKQRWNLWLGYGAPTLAMVLFLWNVTGGRLFGDFDKAYYPSGQLILHNPEELYHNSSVVIGFINFPIVAALFIPLSSLDQSVARLVLTFLGFSAIALICYQLVKRTGISGWKKIMLVGLFVINGPLLLSLRQGNLTHFVLFLLFAAWWCLEERRAFSLGMLLAVAALIKLPLFLLGFYFFLRGHWQVIAGFMSMLLALVSASFLFFGADLHLTWFQKCILPYVGSPLTAYNVQTVDSFLARLLFGYRHHDWSALSVGLDFYLVKFLLIAFLVGGTLAVCWRAKPPHSMEVKNLEFCITLCLALLIAPISWTHYYLFLLLPLSLYLGGRLAMPQGPLWFGFFGLSVLLISLPVGPFRPKHPIFSPLVYRVLSSHYFFGGLLLLGVMLAARRQIETCSPDLEMT